jgi:hypothetical protein
MLLFLCGLLSEGSYALAQPTKGTVLKDPTSPPKAVFQRRAQALAADPTYELSAIFMRNKQRYAIVNGGVVKTGDSLANMRITNISGTNLTMENTSLSKETNQYGKRDTRKNAMNNVIVLELSDDVTVKTQVKK